VREHTIGFTAYSAPHPNPLPEGEGVEEVNSPGLIA